MAATLELSVQEAKKILASSPIGLNGRWLTRRQISQLGNTWSDLELGEILDYGISPFKFKSIDSVKYYWVDYNSIGPLAKDNSHLEEWKMAYETVKQ